MYRTFQRRIARVLPRWAIDRIKTHLISRQNRGSVEAITVEPSGSSLRCTVGEHTSFLAPRECEFDLSYHDSNEEWRAEFSGITRLARSGGILFDIGAHAGIISALFCAARSTNTVYSFEPSPVSQKRLEVIRSLNQLEHRMFIQPTAIGRDRARLEMLLDPDGGYVQIQHFDHTMWGAPRRIEVSVESIPQAAERLGVIPDFIKLDIESYEYEAVEGALSFFTQHLPVLFFELHHNYLEERKLAPQKVVSMLSDCGYVFFTYTGQPLSARAIAHTPLQGLRFIARAKSA